MHLGWIYSPLMNISQARRPLGCTHVDNRKTKLLEESKMSTLRITVFSFFMQIERFFQED